MIRLTQLIEVVLQTELDLPASFGAVIAPNCAEFTVATAYYNIDRIKTPLLILWGDRDYGVRISMADEYYRLAKQKGKPTEYVLYANEPHGWFAWRPEDLKDAITRVATHYQKHTGQ